MTTINDDQWSKIYKFLQQCPRAYAGKEAKCRQFVTGVHWILRTGAQWRELPGQYGHWNSVYKRFARWCDNGVWQAMHQHFADDPDMENLIIDSTIVRAHPCAAGAPKKRVGKMPRRLDAVVAASPVKSM